MFELSSTLRLSTACFFSQQVSRLVVSVVYILFTIWLCYNLSIDKEVSHIDNVYEWDLVNSTNLVWY